MLKKILVTALSVCFTLGLAFSISAQESAPGVFAAITSSHSHHLSMPTASMGNDHRFVVFDNGNVKKVLNLKNKDEYKDFEVFCASQGESISISVTNDEGLGEMIIVNVK